MSDSTRTEFHIYFSNSKTEHNQDTRMCTAYDFYEAYAVYDALCVKFLHVTMYDSNGKLNRRYCNIYE